jgi:hypothetical protein
MARTYTRAEIRTRARRLADQVNSRLFEDTEIDVLIDAANAAYHQILFESGLSYLETDTGATATAAGTAAYNLPSDFLGLLKLEWRASASEPWRLLRPVGITEDHRFGVQNAEPIGYRLVGSTLVLYPTPVAGYYRLRYVPTCAKLANDAATIDGYNGWEEFVVWSVVAELVSTEESDPTFAIQEREAIRERIRKAAEIRSATDGAHVMNVYHMDEVDPADIWPYRRDRGW